MARPVVLSNSELHVGLNKYGIVHDFYFPHVGMENHAAAKQLRHRIGVYVEGSFSWLDDDSWQIDMNYYKDVLISKIVATNNNLQIRLEFDDCVDSEHTAFLRNIHVINAADTPREVRLFMHQVFFISDSYSSNTVQYLAEEHSVLHYKGHRAFLVNGCRADGTPFDTYSVGLFNIEGHEGTYKDAEDGELMRNDVEHGSVDSVIGFHLPIKAHSSQRVHYWIAAGRSQRDVKRIDTAVRAEGMLHHLLKTARWWAEWIKPAKTVAKKLPEKYQSSFIRSALIIKAHTDKHGAVIASTDTTMLKYERDSYAYCWTRDAAYSLWPLMRLGYTDELLRFFSFARRSLQEGGYLGHKYNADGALGPSWHPYRKHNDIVTPPIQSDETAITLFLFGQYYRMHPEETLLRNFYVTLVEPMANFLSGYVDEKGLPLPSYDLWEEKYLTTTYTTALTYASLLEAAYLAQNMNDHESADRWKAAAKVMSDQKESFYNKETNYFYKGYLQENGATTYDATIDSSSLFGVFMYGYFDMDTPQVTQSYDTLRKTLVRDSVRVVRYKNDAYRRVEDSIGNPWPVTSLWYAQYALEKNDPDYAISVLEWVLNVMFSSGALSEQYDGNNNPMSVTPLAWSQAEYLNVLLDMITNKEDA